MILLLDDVTSRTGRLLIGIHKLSLFPEMMIAVKSVTDLIATEAEREEYLLKYIEHVEVSLSSNPCEENPDDPSSRLCPLHDGHVRDDSELKSTPVTDVRDTLLTSGWSPSECDNLILYVSSQLEHIPISEKTAVRAYTHDLIHKPLNNAMRRGNHVWWDPFIGCLSRGLQLLPLSSSDDLVLYRGQSDLFGVSYAVGDTVRWPGFTSTSSNRDVAVRFCFRESSPNKYIFEIRGINREYLGAKISSLSFYPREDEILVMCNCKLTVRSVADEIIGDVSGKVIGLLFCEEAEGSPSYTSRSPQQREGTEHCTFCEIERILSREPVEPSSSCPALRLLHSPPVVQSLMRHPHRGNQVMRILQPHRTVTWLYMAAQNGHADVVRRLLTLYADPLFQEDSTGWTPLHAAVYDNRLDCAKAIVEFSDRMTHNVLMRIQDHSHRTVLDEGTRQDIPGGTRNETSTYVQEQKK